MTKFLIIAILAFSAVLVLSLPYGEEDGGRHEEGFGSSNQRERGFGGGHQGTYGNSGSGQRGKYGEGQNGGFVGTQIGTKHIFTEHGGRGGAGGYQTHGY